MLSAGRADEFAPRPRPRPQPVAEASPAEPGPTELSSTDYSPSESGEPPAADSRTIEQKPRSERTPKGPRRPRRRPGRQLARVEAAQPAAVVAAAGNAVVSAAKIGRILTRSSWRIARQVPGVNIVEAQAQRLRDTAAHEMARLLELQQSAPATPITAEEQRVMALVQDADLDRAPLRTAMSELLERSARADGTHGSDYLFGTIMSQLVPDEARILAALSSGRSFATVDVVAKQLGRSATHPALANRSSIATSAGLSRPQSIGTYLGRLEAFGLIVFGPPEVELDSQFDALVDDRVVRDAKADVERGKGSAKIVRKSLRLSPLGQEFWSASAPSRPDRGPRG